MFRLALIFLLSLSIGLSYAQNSQYEITGDAYSFGVDSFVLTPSVAWQNGSVWNKLRHNFLEDFMVAGKFYFGDDDLGADGIAFVIQDQCLATGTSGGGIGYENFPGNSIAVEFDTYENSGGFPNDPPYDHTAILQNGNIDHNFNLAGPVQIHPANANVEDDLWHTFLISYNASAQLLDVYFDGNQRFSYSIDIPNTIFMGDSLAYWGFTSATGGAWTQNSLIIDSAVSFSIPDITYCVNSTMVFLPKLPATNLALNQPSVASSVEAPGFEEFNAFDGDITTRWSSTFVDPQWITVDLGSLTDIDSVKLFWEGAYATEYRIQTSTDNIGWTDLFHETAGDGGIDVITNAATNIRYVRMLGLQRATAFGYSLWEFEVYAGSQYAWSPNDGSIDDTTSNAPTFSPTQTTTYSVQIPDNCLGTTTFEFTIFVECDHTNDSVYVSLCEGESYTRPSSLVISPQHDTTVIDSFVRVSGADSVITTFLTVFPNFSNQVFDTICSDEDYLLPDGNQTNLAGTYMDTFQSINGCDSILTTFLAVNQKGSFSGIEDVVTCMDTEVLLEIEADEITNFQWFIHANNSFVSLIDSSSYSGTNSESLVFIADRLFDAKPFQIEMRDACQNSFIDTINVSVETCRQACQFTVPNAFSPNQDGENDEFRTISSCDTFPYGFNLKIYNRWGTMVFSSIQHTAAWDGRYEGEEQPLGTYTYTLNYFFDFSEFEQNQRGTIQLLR